MYSKNDHHSKAFSKNSHIVDKHGGKHTSHSAKTNRKEQTVAAQPSALDFTNGRTNNDLNAMGSTYSTKPKDNFEPNNRLIKRGNALEKTPYNAMKRRKYGGSE